MTRRPTPIERHIAGESGDRRERYAAKAVAAGHVRVCFWLPAIDVDAFRRAAADRRQMWDERIKGDDDFAAQMHRSVPL